MNDIIDTNLGEKINITLKPSEITQDGTPTPDVPIEVNTVTGNNTITISNEDNTQSQNYIINLGSIEYAKIGSAEDKIYRDDNGDWYFEEHIGKIILKTTGWTLNNNCFQTENVYPTDMGDTSIGAFINQYKYNSIHVGITSVLVNNEFGWNTSTRLTIKDTRFSSASDFMSALGTEKPKLYYPLTTPTTTQLTDTTLLAQLENLYQNATAYEGKTIIRQTNDNLPFVIDYELVKDLGSVLSNINEFLRKNL